MRSTLITVTALMGLALAVPPDARGQLALEFRGAFTNPVGDFGDAEGFNANAGPGFGADIIYSFNPTLSLYGGWSSEWYDCEACGDDEGLTSMGFEGGAKILMSRQQGVLPWVRAGVLAHQLDVEEGGTEVTSDWGIGYQASVGLDIPLTSAFLLSPALRYQAYEAEFADEVATTDVRQVSLDLGLHIHFGDLGSD